MPDRPLVSVIIPAWRDDVALDGALASLPRNPRSTRNTRNDAEAFEVIVSFVLGEDGRYERLRQRHPDVRWVAAPRGRAAQMNAGAAAAAGCWLLFLHADSRLPGDWLDVIAGVDQSGDHVGGSFRFALDSRDWQARLIELGVRLRVALLGLPYGDQALFVRRRTFEALGGYRDLPLMEDVDLVRRLKRMGPLFHSASPIVTSSRRWERDGWLRRSGQNARLAARFLLGASPARLAQRYFRRERAAIVVMARAPWTPGKTRLARSVDGADHADLRHALFLDTLDVARSVTDVEHVVACEPADACERMCELAGPGVDVIAQRGSDLGERLANVFEDAFRLGVESVVVVGSDLPDLPPRLLRRAIAVLAGARDRIVLGPAADGGYYLVGMNRPHPEVFRRVDWSTDRVLDQTLAAASALDVVLLDEWRDVDEPADLDRLVHAAADPAALRTRAWMSRLAARSGSAGWMKEMDSLQRFDAAATHVSTSASNGPPRPR